MAKAAIENNLTRPSIGMPDSWRKKTSNLPASDARYYISVNIEFNSNNVCFCTMKFIKGMESQVRRH